MSTLLDRRRDEIKRLKILLDECCTCHANLSCRWCAALSKDEAKVFNGIGDWGALKALLAQKLTAVNNDEEPKAVLILPFDLVIERTAKGDRIAVMDVAGQEVYIIPRGDFDEETKAFSDVTRIDILRVHDSKLTSITPAMIEHGGMPKVDTMHGLEHAALLALLGGPAERETAHEAEVLHLRLTRIKAHTPNEELRALLCIFAELDEEVLTDVYDITRASADADAPLDKAVYAWKDAGCPT